MRSTDGRFNYILFSDVHLGSDLVQHARPWTLAKLKRAARIDHELVSMLSYYRGHADPAVPWRLVIAGDLVDFIGMSVAPMEDPSLAHTLTEEEREHGLGSTDDHAAYKMRAVVERHARVFDELAMFISEGHSIVLIRGNHDIDFHWEKARHVFVDAVLDRIPDAAAYLREALHTRIEFHPWFYYVEGLLYVEHGHQYDELCSYPHLLAPYSAADPKRTTWSFADVLLRFIVRPTRGLDSEGHEHLTFVSYLRLAWSLGARGALHLGWRYLRAIFNVLVLWRTQVSEHVQWLRAEHERRMEELAARVQLGVDKLRALASLGAKPAIHQLGAIVRNLFIERILFAVTTFWVFVWCWLLSPPGVYWVGLVLASLGSYGAVHRWSTRGRVIDASEALRRGAERIAALMPAKFIVMGHTHQPRVQPIQAGGTHAVYVNLGNWGVDDIDVDERPYDAPRTHLVIRHLDGAPRAEFCRWNSKTGVECTPLSLVPSGVVSRGSKRG
jgi:UDP-2,3-diacylglucosamine pyrophosphatase LpxH